MKRLAPKHTVGQGQSPSPESQLMDNAFVYDKSSLRKLYFLASQEV